jgi:hypothetical protein
MAIIVWTIRLSLICFFAALIGWTLRRHDACWDHSLKGIWTAGFGLFLAHVLAAFHFHHHWNHQASVDETARQTRELLGFEFGAGVYFNYLFLALWGLDVVWLWSASARLKKTYRWLQLLVLAYLLFIAFNGAAIFKTGWIRLGAILAVAIVATGLLLKWKEHSRNGQNQIATDNT